MLKIDSIPCLHLPVTDVEISVRWWQEYFHLKLESPYNPGDKMASLRTQNGQWIFLWKVNEV
ncbi:hypothetical protein JOC86_002923 [Bacillus pakistanensis]|uniref:Glyoxalase n=1 Tax=Rossellomorea pakistanensis TaxID=992288 RepID=A0ABS2NET7_9BACI|nr:hypothetical protein [Bacillus pakistanensis]MBM7586371.1 hypothetical protein [Bacillus pakistanensis]